jgi:RNA polymerase sigma-70 factor, ECF subfamily
MLNVTEAELVAAAKAGDHDAYAALMTKYEAMLYGFTFRALRDPDEAADAMQDAFVSAWTHLGSFGGQQNFSAWLHEIARNRCLDLLRRRQRLRWLPWESHAHDQMLHSRYEDEPDHAVERAETMAEVRRTLAVMTPRNRQALMMREFGEAGLPEIGAVMDLSQPAVKSMLFRARDEFMRRWSGVGRDGHATILERWTDQDEATLIRLVLAGWSNRQVGQELGRTIFAVKNKRRNLRRAGVLVEWEGAMTSD